MDSVGFSAISTAKAALGSFIKIQGVALGNIDFTNLFMKGVAKMLPRTPKYSDIWDPQQVLEFLKKWGPAKLLNLMQLSVKTVLLVLLATGHRPQTMVHFSLDNLRMKKSVFKFTITENLKHSRGNAPATEVEIQTFPADKRICPINYLTAYMNRTKSIRTSRKIFITTTAPHNAVSVDTISRWVKFGLQRSGINVKKFAPGSIRAASTNAAYRQGAPLQTILKAAHWSSSSTFATWYKKPLEKPTISFQQAVFKK